MTTTTTSAAKRIFYSWQSDLPARSNRSFIETALDAAAKKLGSATDELFFEAVVDRDTLDVPGAPNIVATIFDKIGAADAFVADVSIIEASAKRPAPNPNVLIELGFALRALGESRVILVANRYFGAVEGLPFDLRQLRCLVYECDPDQSDKATSRRPFADTLKSALASVLALPPTHRLPDIRVKAYRMNMIPGLHGAAGTPIVSISVENHSSSPFFLASISFPLPPNESGESQGFWVPRDVMMRPNSGARIEAGDRYDFHVREADFPLVSETGLPVTCVEAVDRIGRTFRSNDAEFAELVATLRSSRGTVVSEQSEVIARG